MKETMRAILLCGVLLAGCASSGPVPTGNGTFMMTKQSAGGAFVSPGEIKVQLIREATAHCAGINKRFQMTGSTDSKADWVTNPTSEIHYTCV